MENSKKTENLALENGKNNDERAPITTSISPFIIPLQIISLFF